MFYRTTTILLAALVGAGLPAAAEERAGVTFHDLSADEASGIDYRRVPSATNATFERIKALEYSYLKRDEDFFEFERLDNNASEGWTDFLLDRYLSKDRFAIVACFKSH